MINEWMVRDEPVNFAIQHALHPAKHQPGYSAVTRSNEEIAVELIIAMTTAKKHVSNIIQKLEVENRTQAAAKGRSLGLRE